VMEYAELFHRNRGVLDEDQQRALRAARVLVVGCGGIGGTVATLLARSGVGAFTLIDPDRYEPSNMNRQIACFAHTLGRNKAEVVGETLLAINPGIQVDTIPRVVPLEEIDALIERADLVFPAADDYAYSITVFRRARAIGRPALMVVPAGYWATVGIFEPDGPTVERLHAVPPLADYEALRELFTEWDSKVATAYYTTLGGWRESYFVDHVDGREPVAQIAPAVWTASSLGALEVVKYLTGSARAAVSPRFWLLTRRGIFLRHMGRPSVTTLMAAYRRFAWRALQGRFGGVLRGLHRRWWAGFRRKAGR
jgi:tRNA threonylcarbamoyladenosine dehydratase